MIGVTGRRAHSVEELGALFGAMAPNEAQLAASRPLAPRATDVIITPHSKCGTTLLQQMFHQLRTGGDMAFDDISRVVPWIETAASLDVDINAEQVANPRGFKSHLHYEALPPGARYVVSLRDPFEAYDSFYRFMEGWTFEPGTIDRSAFFPFWYRESPGRADYFTHLLSWWARRGERDTLLFTYRGILADRRAAIRRLAAFAEIPCDEALVDLVEERTGRAFMLAHAAPFSDPMMHARAAAQNGLPDPISSAKVTPEGDNKAYAPPEIADAIRAAWAERVEPVTGHRDFASLAAEVDSAREP
jgi:hypothetical protein